MTSLLLRPLNTPIVYQNYFPGEKVEDLLITTKDHQQISAWLIKKDKSKAVILAAGKGCNRLSLLHKANYYLQHNYTVLLPDLRATGNSKAAINSLGYFERLDIEACYNTLKKQGFQTIGVQGHSLGAAAIAYSLKDNYAYDFMILESCYDNMDNAFKNRVHKFYLSDKLFLPMKWMGTWKLGVPLRELNPQKYLAKINCPILFLYGDSEWQIPIDESETNFATCSSAKKQKHIFKGGEHEDFTLRFNQEYTQTLDTFFNIYFPKENNIQ